MGEQGYYIPQKDVIALRDRIEELEAKLERVEGAVMELDCEGAWCGKSPTKNDNGLCGVCKLQQALQEQE